jgi:hypothetical protein
LGEGGRAGGRGEGRGGKRREVNRALFKGAVNVNGIRWIKTNESFDFFFLFY